MGEAEINRQARTVTISSHIITYGEAASVELTERMCREIMQMWNEPNAFMLLHNEHYKVMFSITGEILKDIPEIEILQNTNPKNNYFRVEKFVHGNISFVDGLGS